MYTNYWQNEEKKMNKKIRAIGAPAVNPVIEFFRWLERWYEPISLTAYTDFKRKYTAASNGGAFFFFRRFFDIWPIFNYKWRIGDASVCHVYRDGRKGKGAITMKNSHINQYELGVVRSLEQIWHWNCTHANYFLAFYRATVNLAPFFFFFFRVLRPTMPN